MCCYCNTDGHNKLLRCSSCRELFHFDCATGLHGVSNRTIKTCLKLQFKCHMCSFSEDNALVLKIITGNQLYNARKHASDSNPGEAIAEARPPNSDRDMPILPREVSVHVESDLGESDNGESDHVESVHEDMIVDFTNLQLQAMLEAHGVGSSAPPTRDATVEPAVAPKDGRRKSQRV